jgi:hypothetical protein
MGKVIIDLRCIISYELLVREPYQAKMETVT